MSCSSIKEILLADIINGQLARFIEEHKNLISTKWIFVVYSISLVKQCRWLLEELGLVWISQKCFSDPTASDTVNSARNHPSLKHIVCSKLVAARPAGVVIGI